MASQSYRPRAVVILAHSRRSDWTPPEAFFKRIAEQFRVEVLCPSSEENLTDLASGFTGLHPSSNQLKDLAREQVGLTLCVVLVADEDGMRSLGQSDLLALRRIIASCASCIVDIEAANGVLALLPGVFDGATVTRHAELQMYGAFDLPIQKYCHLVGSSDFTPFQYTMHRNFIYTETLNELNAWQKALLQGRPTPPLDGHLREIVEASLDLMVTNPRPRSHELISNSPAVVLLEGQTLDLSGPAWIISQVVPLDRLELVLAGHHPFPHNDLVVEDDEGVFDTEGLNPHALSSPDLPTYDAIFFLHQPDRASLDIALGDLDILRRIVDLVSQARIVVCEGSTVLLLAAAGLLDGRRAVLPSGDLHKAQRQYSAILWESSDSTFARDGKFTTVTQLPVGSRSFAHAVLASEEASSAEPLQANVSEDMSVLPCDATQGPK